MKNDGMKRYGLVIFDMDGTILDTLEDLRDALNHSLSKYGYRERSLNEVRQFVGNGIKKLVERAVPDHAAEADIEGILKEFLPYYQEHCEDKTKPYAGVIELIHTLKSMGYHTAVVSNKSDSAVQKLCETYFKGLFDYAVGEKEGIRKKPAPDSVFSAMKVFEHERAVYIGDSEVDIETAENAGIDCILVTWGFREKEFLIQHGAKVFADKAEDLLHLLYGNGNPA